jgi:SPP1 gp7 family putative phage head morphogenesis protein
MPEDNVFQQSFWDDDDSELWDELSQVILEVYLTGVDGGIDLLPPSLRVLADFDLINTNALEFARGYHYNKIRGITDTTRKQTQKAISDWIVSGAPLDALETALGGIYGTSRAERIAATEATRVFSMGNQQAFESTGLIDEVQWMTARDDLVCPICGELDGTTLGVGDIDAFPPAHISCRCWVQPILSEERYAEMLEEILS